MLSCELVARLGDAFAKGEILWRSTAQMRTVDRRVQRVEVDRIGRAATTTSWPRCEKCMDTLRQDSLDALGVERGDGEGRLGCHALATECSSRLHWSTTTGRE